MYLLPAYEQIPSIVDKKSFVIQMAPKYLQPKPINGEPSASSRQFSVYEVGVFND
jgi:hypothetical protein